jgi:hypothetical protein
MKTISSTELLKDTPLAKDMRHNPYGKMETIKTQVGSATYRKNHTQAFRKVHR